MTMRASIWFGVLAMVFAFAGCSTADDEGPGGTGGYPSPKLAATEQVSDEGRGVSDAVNELALSLFGELKGERGNVFVSPLSISSALGMTWSGATGTCETQMRDVLGYGEASREAVLTGYQSLLGYLTNQDEPIVEIANGLWSRPGLTLEGDFVDDCAEYFGSVAAQLDPDPVEATKRVNAWVEERTHGRVKDIVPPDQPFSSDTAIVLANALYFKGEWEQEFDASATADADFTTGDGETVIVPLMRRQQMSAPVLENELFQAIELGYKGAGSFGMTAILPRQGHTPEDIIEQLDAATWRTWRESMTQNMGRLAFPKLKMEYEKELGSSLKALGMTQPFIIEEGNFDRMIPQHPLGIERVLHKTFLEITEKGTEAAGATVVDVRASDVPEPFEITFDRPFLLVIHGTGDDTILFMGKISDPTA